jgi:2-(1,2-epoxy-1,2-dihydrophenyl)acetyl-CoA isomerase
MSTIKSTFQDCYAVLTMDDPATLNAMSPIVAEDLTTALTEAGEKSRAIVLTGAGRGFCSGANLSGDAIGGGMGASFDAGISLEQSYNPLMLTIRDLPVPLITAVNGAAAGIGASVAMAGDLIIAAKSAYFLQAFSRIGLVPDGGSPWLLTRAVGRVRAMELMLLAEKIYAPQALEWGLVNRVVADDELMDFAIVLAEKLAAGPTSALAKIRRMTWAAQEHGFEAELSLERNVQCEAGRHKDFAEGVSAFLEKRPAKFGG